MEEKFITPDMFCIPWFITMFASKVESIDVVLEFWSRITDKDVDETIVFFIALALILKNKQSILNSD